MDFVLRARAALFVHPSKAPKENATGRGEMDEEEDDQGGSIYELTSLCREAGAPLPRELQPLSRPSREPHLDLRARSFSWRCGWQ